ncbi:hypothetical protein DA2_1951 [Desulfovibrio sp. A2]|nr:hypothetical protein DA2_1951 [Desulfovibrio sp. A2]
MLRHGSGLLGTAEYVGTGTARDTGTIRRPCTAARLVRGRKSLYLSPTRRAGPPPFTRRTATHRKAADGLPLAMPATGAPPAETGAAPDRQDRTWPEGTEMRRRMALTGLYTIRGRVRELPRITAGENPGPASRRAAPASSPLPHQEAHSADTHRRIRRA